MTELQEVIEEIVSTIEAVGGEAIALKTSLFTQGVALREALRIIEVRLRHIERELDINPVEHDYSAAKRERLLEERALGLPSYP